MKIKNIQLTILVFLGLVVLSFSAYVSAQQNSNPSGNIFLDSDQDGLTDQEEQLYGTDPRNSDTDGDGYSDGTEVKSGYDPKKPAPGDKIETVSSENGKVLGDSDENNMTSKVAQKISEVIENSQSTDSEGTDTSQVSLDQIQNIIDETLSAENGTGINEDSLPEVKKEDIKILEQNYSKLSSDEQKKRKKDDFLNYCVAVAYIFSSNSPSPITSSQDINKIISQIYQNVLSAVDARNPSGLTDLQKSGDKILEQLKEVEVPEEMVDTHIKAMKYAMYAQGLAGALTPNSNDPLKDIANFSKIGAFVNSLDSFMADIQTKFNEYDTDFSDPELQKKLKKYGLDKIDVSNVINSALGESSSESNSSSSDSSSSN